MVQAPPEKTNKEKIKAVLGYISDCRKRYDSYKKQGNTAEMNEELRLINSFQKQLVELRSERSAQSSSKNLSFGGGVKSFFSDAGANIKNKIGKVYDNAKKSWGIHKTAFFGGSKDDRDAAKKQLGERYGAAATNMAKGSGAVAKVGGAAIVGAGALGVGALYGGAKAAKHIAQNSIDWLIIFGIITHIWKYSVFGFAINTTTIIIDIALFLYAFFFIFENDWKRLPMILIVFFLEAALPSFSTLPFMSQASPIFDWFFKYRVLMPWWSYFGIFLLFKIPQEKTKFEKLILVGFSIFIIFLFYNQIGIASLSADELNQYMSAEQREQSKNYMAVVGERWSTAKATAVKIGSCAFGNVAKCQELTEPPPEKDIKGGIEEGITDYATAWWTEPSQQQTTFSGNEPIEVSGVFQAYSPTDVMTPSYSCELKGTDEDATEPGKAFTPDTTSGNRIENDVSCTGGGFEGGNVITLSATITPITAKTTFTGLLLGKTSLQGRVITYADENKIIIRSGKDQNNVLKQIPEYKQIIEKTYPNGAVESKAPKNFVKPIIEVTNQYVLGVEKGGLFKIIAGIENVCGGVEGDVCGEVAKINEVRLILPNGITISKDRCTGWEPSKIGDYYVLNAGNILKINGGINNKEEPKLSKKGDKDIFPLCYLQVADKFELLNPNIPEPRNFNLVISFDYKIDKVYSAERESYEAVLENYNLDELNIAKLTDDQKKVVEIIKSEAQEQGVKTEVAIVIGYVESRFHQNRISPAGAIGVMQVMPSTGAYECKMTMDDLRDESKNIECGVTILKHYYDRYGTAGCQSSQCKRCGYNSLTGWQAAMRGYIGFGCKCTYCDKEYVNRAMNLINGPVNV